MGELYIAEQADENKTHQMPFIVQGWSPDTPKYSHMFNVIRIRCNRLTIKYFIQLLAHVATNNCLLFCDASIYFGPYRPYSGKLLKKEDVYNK